MNRRTFIRSAFAAGATAVLGSPSDLPVCSALAAGGGESSEPANRKLVVVVFGGGVRSSETIDDAAHRYIPRLWKEMLPRGTLLDNMRVEHRVVHPNSTGSILTGHWEWDDIDWSRPVAHPTLFEICRRTRRAPDTSAWAFVYASILAKAGESLAQGYGPLFGANVVEPPTISRSTAEQMDHQMRLAASTGTAEAELDAIRSCERLARTESQIARGGLRSDTARQFLNDQYQAWRSDAGTTSHDVFLTDRALACMKQFAPDILVVAYGEIDCAHYGSWSRYVEAIRRTDELTWRLWRATEELDAYRNRTLMLVLPDHGRELDRPGGSGFIHHSDFYTNQGADEGCRRVWMLALGAGIRAGGHVPRPLPITVAAATGLEYLGLPASPGAAGSVLSMIT